ncbi:hypothetical protein PAHAL_3G057700 [Panicum hallii]|uniref:Uncharacterized protein n=1 Tax=Panicum hallii TaxID=206008 RepID=A0A2S3H6L7_9POAL|nr:hypothetical protein PAHAL_3G057700 [Panicum hallii]
MGSGEAFLKFRAVESKTERKRSDRHCSCSKLSPELNRVGCTLFLKSDILFLHPAYHYAGKEENREKAIGVESIALCREKKGLGGRVMDSRWVSSAVDTSS